LGQRSHRPGSLGYTEKAVTSARSARQKRWICFFIFLIILGVAGAIVAIEVEKNKK
jgi:syntaxin 1B/2/3